MKSRKFLALVVVLGLSAVACDSGEASLSTTSSLVTGTTATADVDASTTTTTTEEGGEDPVTSTTLIGETVTTFTVEARISSDNGEILYIVIPEGAYTDVDLENFIGDLIESDPGLWGAEVFDSEDGPQAFRIPEEQRTDEQKKTLEDHHFVSLIGGDTVKFQGPFESFGEYVIGS